MCDIIDESCPKSIFKDNVLYLEGVYYYFDSSSPSEKEDDIITLPPIFTRKSILSTFYHLMKTDRDKAIEYTLSTVNRIATISQTCEKDYARHLLGSLLSRKHCVGLKTIFGITLTRPVNYIETFGRELIEYSTCGPKFSDDLTPPCVSDIRLNKIYGQGTYGIVYSRTVSVTDVVKFNTTSNSYITEFLSIFLLMYHRSSTLNYNTVQINPSTVHLHEIRLKLLAKNSYKNVLEPFKSLIIDLSLFTEYSYMHTDINPNNVLWDNWDGKMKFIDFGGTMGDDSFYDLGERTYKLCTKTSRPNEYNSSDTLYLRDERSELFSLFYTITEMTRMGGYKTRDLLPSSKYDIMRTFAKDAGIAAPYFSISESEQCERPSLNSLLRAGGVNYNQAPASVYMTSLHDCVKQLFGRTGRNETVRRVSFYFSMWKTIFATIDLPCNSVREEFISELSVLFEDESCGELLISKGIPTTPPPIFIFFRCVHLFDALYRRLDHIPIKIMAMSLLYICMSLAKMAVIQISHYESHPVYQILREFFSVPELINVLLTPLTAYMLFAIDTNDRFVNKIDPPWFKCLYASNPERRFYIDLGIDVKIKAFSRYYYSCMKQTAITEPLALFESYMKENDMYEKPDAFITNLNNYWF